jgi:hypothetical protein
VLTPRGADFKKRREIVEGHTQRSEEKKKNMRLNK